MTNTISRWALLSTSRCTLEPWERDIMTGIALRIGGLVPAFALISLLVSGTAWGQFVKIDDFEGRTVGEMSRR